jgi:hypothetical protein
MPKAPKPIPTAMIATVQQAQVIVQDLLDATKKRGPLSRLDRMRVLHVNCLATFLDHALNDLLFHLRQLHV